MCLMMKLKSFIIIFSLAFYLQLFSQKHQLFFGFDTDLHRTRQHVFVPQSRLNKGNAYGLVARLESNHKLSYQIGYFIHHNTYNNRMIIDDGLILKSVHQIHSFPFQINYSFIKSKMVKLGPLVSFEICHTNSEKNSWKYEASSTPTGVWDNTYKVYSFGVFNEFRPNSNIIFGYHLNVKYNYNANNLLVKSRFQQGIGFYVLFSFLDSNNKLKSCFSF